MKHENIREVNNKSGLAYKVVLNYNAGGERKQYTKTFPVKQFANKSACLNAAKTHRDVMKIKLSTSGLDKDMTLEEVYELRRKTYSLAPGTEDNKTYLVNKYIYPVIDKNIRFSKITYLDILNTLQPLVNTQTDNVIKEVYTLWRQLYHAAVINDVVQVDQTVKVIRPVSRVTPKKRNVATDYDSVQQALNSLPDTEYANKMKLSINIMYYTGIRPAEVYALSSDDIDLENKTISINKAIRYGEDKVPFASTLKTPTSLRTLPIDDELLPMLENLPEGFIFVHNGKFLSATSVGQYMRHYCKGFTLYMLRHLFATDLIINSKQDVATVQKLMGHSNISTTVAYTRVADQDLKDAIKARKRK